MNKDTLVIYHAKCVDGFTAAWCAWLALGDTADYLPMFYGKAPPDVTGKRVFILDFSFPPEVLAHIDGQAREIVLLDHHQSAAEQLAGYKCRCGKVHFDLGKCGARLAWEHFHPGKPAPRLVDFVEDRDLWEWQLADSKAFLSALDALEPTFDNWRFVWKMDEALTRRFIDDGAAMLRKSEAYWRSIAKNALPVNVLGVRGLMVNAPGEFRDELGSHLAAESGTYGLVWTQVEADLVKVSLRSTGAFECLALAQQLGGGGHPHAASFSLPLARVPELMQGRLTAPNP